MAPVNSEIRQFIADRFLFGGDKKLGGYSAADELAARLPTDLERRDMLSKAQYLEDKLFLSNYLLTSQGDRMAMANSVEIRPPYLDFRIIDFMSRVSPTRKILGLDEKHILKRAFRDVLPPSITKRTKHPYRAPIQKAFVGRLLRKLDSGESTSETEGMAIAGILSTQLLAEEFVKGRPEPGGNDIRWNVHVDKRVGRAA
jgi:asparagine synthase (glutamine-hydrolysing)